jgi:hypothetical protein
MVRPTDGNEPSEQSDHPDLTGIAGEMRAEWRAEQDAAAVDAAAQWRYSRGLEDWLRDCMHGGDRVEVVVASQSFVGTVEEVGADLVALRCVSGRVEIQVCAGIPITFERVERAKQGGTRALVSRVFRDALVARDEQDGIRVGTLQRPDGIVGKLLVGRDFVTIVAKSGTETIIPIAHVAWLTLASA